MKSLRLLASLAVLALTLLAAQAPAVAQTSDLEENPVVPALCKFYGIGNIQTLTVMQNVTDPDDLLVTLFLSRASGRKAIDINTWRKSGRSWQNIIQQLGVNPATLFVDLNGVKVPAEFESYAWAQRKYEAWKVNPKGGLTLYDKTVRELVGLDFMVHQFDMTPVAAMKARQGAKSYMALIEARLK